ncbi:MAG TPA: efflux RND transporter periplasmic adaptor subunit [Opitutaceae bacterium]|jgi:HlyD family secretion protein|nr:efflux RND transporter periplasmic adaptor subunit [Opitutaceae bacterium]
MKRKRMLLLAGAAVALVLILYFALGPSARLTLTGIVTTDDVIISPLIQGRLQQLLVEQGDTVKKGQLLAVMLPAEWQASFDYYQSGERLAASQVAQGTADLKYQRELTASQIAQADAGLASAQAQAVAADADLENAQLAFRREEQLRQTGTDSQQAYDTARTAYDGSKARATAAAQQAAAAAAALDLAKANESQVSAREAALQGDTQNLAAMAAQREKARVYLGYTEIRAPLAAVVDVRAARAGETLLAGQPILTLVDPDGLWVRADVEESYIDRIRLGDQLTVRLPSGQERQGTVFFRGADAQYATQRDVSRTKRDIKTFELRLRCDNRDRALALGMTAYVTLPLPR